MCHEDRKLKSDPKMCHMPRLNVPEFHDEICKHLDSTYRKGYVKDNPLLVGQLVIAAAIDEVGSLIASKIADLREYLRSNYPLMGETLDGVSEAIQNVAIAIKTLRPDTLISPGWS
jgi:hypothetical protein